MDFAQIEAFLILCDELHFGRTAQRLHVSQPRISRLVAALESTVGGALFDRTSRRVIPTPLGVRLRDELAPAYEQMATALAAARAAARSPAGLLRIGFAATTADPAVDQLVTAFERAQPDCVVSLHEVPLTDSYTPLRSGEIDVLVCWLVLDEPDLTRGPTIAEYPRVLAVAADHPLAHEQSVSVEVLGDYPVPHWAYQRTADRVRERWCPRTHRPAAPCVNIRHPSTPSARQPASSPAAMSWHPPWRPCGTASETTRSPSSRSTTCHPCHWGSSGAPPTRTPESAPWHELPGPPPRDHVPR